ncbi:hypothetical protein ACF0H2_05715 [Serratia marcescens]
MSRSTSRKSGIGLGRRIRSALLAQKQYWKMYFAMKLRGCTCLHRWCCWAVRCLGSSC